MLKRISTQGSKICIVAGCLLGLALLVRGSNESNGEVNVTSDSVSSPVSVENKSRVESLSLAAYDVELESRTSDRFPDIELLDQHGDTVRFYSDLIQDQCVCVVYFYTRCNGSCPTTTQVVRKLREDLSDVFAPGELRFISLSLEPEVDTPEELREYMDRYGIEEREGLADWTYATGEFSDIEELRKSLGIYDLDPVIDADKTEHAAILTFGNDRLDRWAALPVGMDYEQLKKAMVRIMGNSPRQRYAAVAQYREPLPSE